MFYSRGMHRFAPAYLASALAAALAGFTGTPTLAAGNDVPTARAIAEKASRVGSPDSIRQSITMRLVDGKNERVRKLVISRKGAPDAADSATRVEFLEPADVAGTVLLTVGRSGNRTQHLYLPGLKRVRRIAGSQRGGAFVGSDFSYEDLAGRDLDGFDLRLLPDETVGGRAVHVIEATPKKGTDSAYGKTISYVTTEDHLILKVRFFDPKGTETKVLSVDPEKVERKGELRVPRHLEMSSKKDGHRTVLETTEVEIDPKLDDALFDVRSLDRG